MDELFIAMAIIFIVVVLWYIVPRNIHCFLHGCDIHWYYYLPLNYEKDPKQLGVCRRCKKKYYRDFFSQEML